MGYLDVKIDKDEVIAAIRPELIKISEKGQLEATIESFEYLGAQSQLGINCSGVSLKMLTPQADLSIGDTFRVFLPLESLMLFSADTNERIY